MSFSAMGGSLRIRNAGSWIARLVLDDPSEVESFIFYFVAAHVLIGFILIAGWLETRRRCSNRKGFLVHCLLSSKVFGVSLAQVPVGPSDHRISMVHCPARLIRRG